MRMRFFVLEPITLEDQVICKTLNSLPVGTSIITFYSKHKKTGEAIYTEATMTNDGEIGEVDEVEIKTISKEQLECGIKDGFITTICLEDLVCNCVLAQVSVKEAEKAYEKASKQLIETTKRMYPIGSIVTADIGRSVFEAEVVGHSDSWWCDPGMIRARNLKTGKERHFTERSIVE